MEARRRDSAVSSIVFVGWAMLALWHVAARAGQIETLQVHKEQRSFMITAQMVVAAPAAKVLAIIADYEQLYRLDPNIKETAVLATEDPRVTRVRSVIEVCIAIYCKDLVQVQDIVYPAEGFFVATTVPHLSNFEYGVTRLAVEPAPEGTRLYLQMRFTPAFFVPPLIGTWLVKRKLLQEGHALIAALERLVN